MLLRRVLARWLRPALVVPAAALVLLACVAGLGAWTVWDARRDARENAERTLWNLTQALEQDIASSVGHYDAAIRGAVEGMRLPRIAEAGPELRHAALFGRTGDARTAAVLVTDVHGSVAYSELPSPAQVDLADCDYVRGHRERADAGLYASRPFVSRLTGWHNMAFSRRIPRDDGGFGGVGQGALGRRSLGWRASGQRRPGGCVQVVAFGGAGAAASRSGMEGNGRAARPLVPGCSLASGTSAPRPQRVREQAGAPHRRRASWSSAPAAPSGRG